MESQNNQYEEDKQQQYQEISMIQEEQQQLLEDLDYDLYVYDGVDEALLKQFDVTSIPQSHRPYFPPVNAAQLQNFSMPVAQYGMRAFGEVAAIDTMLQMVHPIQSQLLQITSNPNPYKSEITHARHLLDHLEDSCNLMLARFGSGNLRLPDDPTTTQYPDAINIVKNYLSASTSMIKTDHLDAYGQGVNALPPFRIKYQLDNVFHNLVNRMRDELKTVEAVMEPIPDINRTGAQQIEVADAMTGLMRQQFDIHPYVDQIRQMWSEMYRSHYFNPTGVKLAYDAELPLTTAVDKLASIEPQFQIGDREEDIKEVDKRVTRAIRLFNTKPRAPLALLSQAVDLSNGTSIAPHFNMFGKRNANAIKEGGRQTKAVNERMYSQVMDTLLSIGQLVTGGSNIESYPEATVQKITKIKDRELLSYLNMMA